MNNLELLRPLFVQGIFESKIGMDRKDFKSWISTGKYNISKMLDSRNIVINVNNDTVFYNMLVFDSCRMATASCETMESIKLNENLPKSFGWLAIQCYYAAFFAAHSIMRCFGYICSQLEKGHINMLCEYASALNLKTEEPIESGFYSGVYDSCVKNLFLRKMKNTHEDTWYSFAECLKSISIEVLYVNGLTKNKQLLSAYLDGLIIGLNHNRHDKGNFLSYMRNSINYRQDYCSWHPYGKKSLKTKKIMEMVRNWSKETVPITGVWKDAKDIYVFLLLPTMHPIA